MNNFDFIMGFYCIIALRGRIIPDRKFISYFPLRNSKNALESINERLKKLMPFHEKNDALIYGSNFSEVQ